MDVSVPLRQPIDIAPPLGISGALAVSSLGVAYQVLNEVDSVVAGKPRRQGGFAAGRLDCQGDDHSSRRGGVARTGL